MKGRVPERGDIIDLDFDPTRGHETQGRRPALVLSLYAFNRQSGFALVCPITQGGRFAREHGFAVSLAASGSETQGVVLCDQLRTLDLKARRWRLLEAAPASVVEEALLRSRTLLD
ncbi:MAG: type II toxin-antitoxin system ChpB family toxin [Proteobacteria bacterium]|nr:type II toxin-antitoxin system ChpB family toxin [Pseudomonadota bacterium]